MERRSGQRAATCALFLYLFTQVSCQLCGGPCYCPRTVPLCPAGVPLILDGCRCCQVCARQRGEACDEKYVCDSQRGLQCDYSASFPGGPGECISQEELGCELNGVTYQEGQVFQPSCATQCRCSGGGVTCVPLCRMDVRLPSPDCPNPQHVQLPGKCCKEWVCENMDNTVLQDALAASRPDGTRPRLLGPNQNAASNCIEQSTEWSACSRSCGPGVSYRVSNRNWACRLERQTRLCQVRPCQAARRRIHMGIGRCESSYRAALPERLEHRGCYSTRAYRLKYCSLCSDSRCCTPYQTHTVRMAFRCPRGRYRIYPVMVIDSCVCHYNCPYTYTAAGTILRA
ncbi:WNT1-inducible-signaling pathway protein 2 [Megalops cyprinoides]|uniref:WNT1-inducible-signaling pathway protein 2 n=1 Tax=Megalops cyprinoides TaxID=118141 RepID=UPI001864B2DF|nr:WNT1-inducible-signaling pathway protein 2 [Megalops cyprinoides]